MSDRICGCAGCHEPAAKTIRHPKHGQRVVCSEHATGAQATLDEEGMSA